MEFLKSLIKQSEPVQILEKEQSVEVETVGKYIGDFLIFVTRMIIDNYDLRDYKNNQGIAYDTHGGEVSEIYLGIIRKGGEQYKAEVLLPQPVDTEALNGDTLSDAEITIYSAPNGARSHEIERLEDPELAAMLEKMVAGYLASNINTIVRSTFDSEGEPPRNPNSADYD